MNEVVKADTSIATLCDLSRNRSYPGRAGERPELVLPPNIRPQHTLWSGESPDGTLAVLRLRCKVS